MPEPTQDAPRSGPEPAPRDPSKPSNVDELIADLNRVPLFMTSLDETNGAGGSNVELDALKALQYEGTKSEVADNFRQQGNECARAKKWRDARDFYTQALDVLRSKADGVAESADQNPSADDAIKKKLNGDVGAREVDWLDSVGDIGEGEAGKVVDVEEEDKKMRECEELCRANRALCSLELKNFGSASRDCSRALSLNPKNTKAYYRSATALLALDKTEPALSAVELGTQVASHSSDAASLKTFKDLLDRIKTRAKLLAKQERERIEREQSRRLERLKLTQALQQRGVVTKDSAGDKQPDLEDAAIALEDPTDEKSELRTPVLLLYPTAAQSELVKAVRESETMAEVLGIVLPVPWDEEAGVFGGSDGAKVECFVETAAGGLRKVGKRVRWGRVIEKGGAVVKDGLIAVHVVPKSDVDTWMRDWKRRNGR